MPFTLSTELQGTMALAARLLLILCLLVKDNNLFKRNWGGCIILSTISICHSICIMLYITFPLYVLPSNCGICYFLLTCIGVFMIKIWTMWFWFLMYFILCLVSYLSYQNYCFLGKRCTKNKFAPTLRGPTIYAFSDW